MRINPEQYESLLSYLKQQVPRLARTLCVDEIFELDSSNECGYRLHYCYDLGAMTFSKVMYVDFLLYDDHIEDFERI